MNCPQCSTDLPSDAAFCLQCGAQVGEAPSVPEDQLLRALEKALGSAYEVLRLLGRGGMGAVYLGRDRALDRLVAIKVLPPESTDAESTERFRREARTAANLNHPNIVPLYTFGEGEGILYFVMGYVSGESLRDRIRRLGRIEAGEARRILVEIAGALHYAHEQRVVHRDVKPDNILLEDKTGKPMLTDFGVAKSAVGGETLTALGTALGTPYYMSPEQAAGDREIDGRSDLYSLGIIGYQMLAGQLPFEGETVQEILVQHMTKQPIPLKTMSPTTPADLADVVSRCLVKDPDDRISDGHVLQRCLGTLAASDAQPPESISHLVDVVRGLSILSVGTWYVSGWVWLWGDALTAAGIFATGFLWPPACIQRRRQQKLTDHSWPSILKWALRKPKLWSGWWPSGLRSSDDNWDRLPQVVRRARVALTALIGTGVLALPVIFRSGLGPPDLFWIHGVTRVVMAIVFPAAGVWVWHSSRAFRWLRRAGLTRLDRQKFLTTSERDTRFWNQPHIQKLLAPAVAIGARAGAPSLQTPRDYAAALREVAHLMGGPEREIGEAAAAAGQEIADALEAAERRIESLARDADPAELTRLERRLAELGESQPGESDAQRRMRALVEEQLELGRSLTDQLAVATARRDRLSDLLKTLWLHVANLKARATETAFDSGEISDKIHAIAEDVQRYVEATDETLRLLEN